MMHKTPPMTDFLRPILQWASKKSTGFNLHEVTEAMANHFDLSPEARKERTAGDNAYCVYDKTTRALNPHLKEAGLVHSSRRGHYEITNVGREEAFSSDKRMTYSYLMRNFSSYREYREKQKNKRI